MFYPTLAAFAMLASAHAAPSHAMDQAVRQLAAEFASQQLGMNPFHAAQGAMASVCAALKVVDPGLCGTTASAAASPAPAAKPPAAVGGGPVFYVSPGGSDSAAGTLAAPFATLSRAQLATRQTAAAPTATTTPPATVYLLPGRYELGAAGPLVLTPEDSGTTWAAAPGAPSGSAVLSGGVDLGTALAWAPVTLKNGHAAMRAKLPAAAAEALALGPGMRSLLVDGRRQVAARWPNANPEKDFFPKGYATGAWGAKAALGATTRHNLTTHAVHGDGGMRTKDAGGGSDAFDSYTYVTGGAARLWADPLWAAAAAAAAAAASNNNSNFGSGSGADGGFSFDDGQDYTHQMYGALLAQPGAAGGRDRLKSWAEELRQEQQPAGPSAKSTAWVHTLNDGFWGNWMFKVAAVDEASGAVNFSHPIDGGGGGWQDQAGAGWEDHCVWFAEGLVAELDAPGEWWYDAANATLYLIPDAEQAAAAAAAVAAAAEAAANGSTAAGGSGNPMAGARLVVPLLESVVRLEGTLAAPVRDVTLRGLTLRDTLPTYTQRYTIPGPGDWSIYPGGALFLRGTERATLTECVLTHAGGNALFLSRYNANASIVANEFAWSGDSAIAAAGFADYGDATAGDFPRGCVVEQNHIHDLGVYGKQTSAYFQTLSAGNTVRQNVIYNGPRAGICLNDGMGGGNLLEGNLLFNLVRETNDHGPINSWDRVPFKTSVGDPADAAGVRPALSSITRNFVINYGSAGLGTTGGVWNLDHDDGSAWYADSYNFLVYAGTKNYLGDSKRFFGNLIVHPDAGYSSTPYCHHECSDWFAAGTSWRPDGGAMAWGEYWQNNTCVMQKAGDSPVAIDGLDGTKLAATSPILGGNNYYLRGGAADYAPLGSGGNFSFADMQASGNEVGSRVLKTPPATQDIINMGRDLLLM